MPWPAVLYRRRTYLCQLRCRRRRGALAGALRGAAGDALAAAWCCSGLHCGTAGSQMRDEDVGAAERAALPLTSCQGARHTLVLPAA
jgi:hypothetical protein